MIQDIAPHVYDNHYEEQAAGPQDAAALTERTEAGDHILLLEEGEGYRFPTVSEALAAADQERQDRATGERYLFSVDALRFFRLPDLSPIRLPGSRRFTRRELREVRPRHVAYAAVTALALDGWYRNNRFCSRCGTPLEDDRKERMRKCPACGLMVYPRINPAVIVGVTRGDSLLMTKYAGGTYRRFALVAGFTEIGETLEQTVAREVKEETGLSVNGIRYYKSQPWPFTDTVLMGFYCEAEEGQIRMDDGELAVAEWVKREDINRVQDGYDDTSLTNEMICYFRDHPEEFPV